jgi:putative addiction module CopG family antidote
MTHRLSAEVSARIQAQIATGHFDSEDDLIRQALDALERRERGLESLRALVREAEEDVVAGRVGLFTSSKRSAEYNRGWRPDYI